MATIHYFAFGADLIQEKMKKAPFPSELKGGAVLRGWKLVFQGDDERWKGAAATIHEDNVSCVWGIVYKVPQEHLAKLDAENPGYKPISVRVLCAKTNEPIECRAYQFVNTTAPIGKPSPHLRFVIETGAGINKLPVDYLKKLEKLEDNGYAGKVFYDLDIIKPYNV